MYVVNGQRAGITGGAGDFAATGVGEGHPHLEVVGVGRGGAVLDAAAHAGQSGDDGDVVDIRGRGGVEPDVAVQAGVVEEVVEVALPLAIRRVLDEARGYRLPGQGVVHDHGDPVLDAEFDDVGDVGFERRVSALMLGDLSSVDPRHRPMGRRVEPQHDPLPGPTGGTHTAV